MLLEKLSQCRQIRVSGPTELKSTSPLAKLREQHCFLLLFLAIFFTVKVSQNVRMFLCLSVCLFVRHTFSPCLTVFLSALPEVQCPNFLDIRNPWGKVMERSVLRFENICSLVRFLEIFSRFFNFFFTIFFLFLGFFYGFF